MAGAALVLAAASLWATFGLFAKVLYEAGFSPIELASVRTAVAFVAVAIVAVPRLLRSDGGVRVPFRSLPFYAAYGILGFALFELLLLGALDRTTVSIAVALLYTAPAMVAVASVVLWHERLGLQRVAALAAVLIGVLLVTGTVGAVLRGTAPLSGPALAYGLAAGAGYALYTLFSKVATTRDGPLASLFWCFLFATAALAVAASPVAPFLRAPDQALMLLGLGIVPTVLPYALYLAALRELRASTAAMLASVEPVVAALLAAGLLGERLDGLQAAGVLLVVAAAALLARHAARG